MTFRLCCKRVMKITQRSAIALPITGQSYVEWDDETKGFGVRVNADGTRSYIAKYRVGARQKKATIGRVDVMKAEAARKAALKLMTAANDGVDVVEMEKASERAPTINDVADKFTDEFIPYHLKPSTQADYLRTIRLFIRPSLGKEKVADLARREIAAFHQSLSSTPFQANRVLGTLSVMLAQAEIWGMRPEGINPCLRVKRFKERKRERFLSSAEMGRLAKALEEEAATALMAATAFRLLIITGCRLGEIQKLKWRCVDFEREEIRLDDSKTGQRTVYLSPQGIELLKAVPRVPGNPYVIVGDEPGAHLTDLQRPWRRVRKRAGLNDVRIHDLRHTFAANAAASGLSLPMIGKLLGHTQAQTTARYAHLAADPVRRANADVARLIAEAMKSGRPNGN